MSSPSLWIVSFVLVLGFSSHLWGQDTLVFDSFAPPANFGGYSSADGGEASLLSVTQSLSISRIAILNEMLSPGSLEFVILSYPQPQFLYISAPDAFPMDVSGQTTWKESDSLSYTLQPGSEYLVGYLRNVAANDYVYSDPVSESGITSDLSIGTLLGFSAPTYSHIAFTGVDQPLRLYTAVPEPASGTILLAFPLALLMRRHLPLGR